MTKKKKLVKTALKHPELYTDAELSYFRRWLEFRKKNKAERKAAKEADE